MLVREKRNWNESTGNGDKESTSWGIVVKSGTKEADGTLHDDNEMDINVLAGTWVNTRSDKTDELIAFSAATDATTKALPNTSDNDTIHSVLDNDAAYMTLGAWVIYPNPALSSTGKVAYASMPLGSKGMTLLGQYKTAKSIATYSGAAVGVTVSAEDSDSNLSNGFQAKYTYTPWTQGASTLTANFGTMKISGFIDANTPAIQVNGTALIAGDIVLSPIDIGSNYKASGSITTGGGRENPVNHGTWNAEFVNEGTGVIGTFDYRTSADFGKESSKMPLSGQQTDPGAVTNARHYGAFGAK